MRELIETERIYVEELLSVLLVRKRTFALLFIQRENRKGLMVDSPSYCMLVVDYITPACATHFLDCVAVI